MEDWFQSAPIQVLCFGKSSDWVESLTAIIEHLDGRMELVKHEEFILRRQTSAASKPEAPAIIQEFAQQPAAFVA